MNNYPRKTYKTLNEAREATKKLGISSFSKYKKEYRLDPLLPSHPETRYPDWISWQHYLDLPERVPLYSSLEEASAAARSAGIQNSNEYRAHRQIDSRFPRSPDLTYRSNWVDWYSFLGTIRPTKYKTYAEAKSATAKLGVKSLPEYKSLYKQDPMLPVHPQDFYKKDWIDWYHFTGRASFEKYPTYAEAATAARALGFKNFTDYRNGFKMDPCLPQDPKSFYKEDWIDYYSFLGTEPPPVRYATLLEASLAARKFSFRTSYDYFAGRGKDPRLVCKPNETYKKDWISWQHFLGVKSRRKYPTLAIASRVAQKIGFNTAEEYRLGYKQDPGLPAAPRESYRKEWTSWKDFLGNNKYLTIEEASISSRKLGFKSAADYYQGYSIDRRLPALPESFYKDHWTNWYDFLGKTNSKCKYLTFEEARKAAQNIGYKSIRDYRENCKIDPHLPFNPNDTYRDNWTNWSDFLGKNPPREKYKTLVEAKEAANKMGISTSSGYKIAFKADPQLPSNPTAYYVKEWIDWASFLGKPKRLPKYESIEKARRAAQLLSITNFVEYSKHYREDPRLPARPNVQYVNDWIDWPHFLLPVDYRKLQDVKRAVKILSIKDSRDYLNKYKLYPPMPAHPERMFQQEWIDWYDLCDIPRHYDYQDAQSKVIAAGVNKQAEYRKLATSDARLPKDPARFYKESWKNWYVFLGQDEPYKLDYISEPYALWKTTIAEFMKYARGGGDKISFLCQFVRHFIEKFQLGYSPQEFLLREKVDLRLLNPILEGLKNDSRRRAMVNAVKEFLDYVLRVNLSEVDENSGELITTTYASNPLAKLNLVGGESSPKYGESVKPALAYQYVQAARLWITPVGAKTFSDLHSLHVFDADWFEVEPHVIDKNDPDCVWRTIGSRTEIWFPVYWMHTLALISVPARGMQLAYNDSGEGDEWIPDCDDRGQLTWEENKGALSKSTNNQGFIKRYEGDQPGMHFTSNKTSNNLGGYDVPWMPLELAYWMIKLRRWQQRYNPIDTPTPWTDLRRTSLNETQLKSKGENCFLFRNFREVEPGYFNDRLSVRLAASLYHSQPKDLMIAELVGPEDVIRSYVSKYTPHSMRVSLLTAYTVEFGLPIEILMKIAGHSAIVMSLYYVKISSVELRQRFSEGEKRAMKDKAYAAQRMIEQGRIDEIKNDLISNTEDALIKISSDHPPASFLFRDYGICPNAGTRCADGGDVDPGYKYGNAVPHGYLGSQNCLRCRHFISGPAFIGGLLSVSNEISLQSRLQFEHFSELEEQGISLKHKIDTLEDTEYDCQQVGSEFDASELNQLRLRRRKVLSEAESAAKKLDVYLCDLQSAARLIKQCKVLINEGGRHENEFSATKLILQRGHDIDFAMEETSYFRQLSEVCENAEIYEAANSELALTPRTQMLDRMALLNDVNLNLFMLSKKQQLLVGNQLTKVMLDRLRSWERVDALIDGNLFLKDLQEGERITLIEINEAIRLGQQREE